jgi:hypothetical protein
VSGSINARLNRSRPCRLFFFLLGWIFTIQYVWLLMCYREQKKLYRLTARTLSHRIIFNSAAHSSLNLYSEGEKS